MAGETNELVLGDIVTLTRGTTYQSALLGQPGPVLLGLASIKRNGGFRDDNLKTYGGDCPNKLTLRPGDIFVSLKDVTQAAELLGSIARVPRHVPAGRVTQDTVKLNFIRHDIPSRYVYWLLRTSVYREYCRAHAIGTTNLALPREDFLAFPIPRPTDRELTLVEVLDALDDKIELNRRMNATLESMARTLFQSWFVDFDPVRAKLDNRQPIGLDKATADLFPEHLEDSPLGHIPKGWKATTLGACIGFRSGFSFKSRDWQESGVPVVKIGSVKPGIIDLTQVSYVSEEIAQQAIRYRLCAGDMLIGMTGYVGEVGLVPPSGNPPLLNQRVGKFVMAQPGTESLAFWYCTARQPEFKAFVEARSHGTAQANVSGESIMEFPLVAPPSGILDAFNRECQPLFDRILSNLGESRTLATLRDTLLPKLLSGELRATKGGA